MPRTSDDLFWICFRRVLQYLTSNRFLGLLDKSRHVTTVYIFHTRSITVFVLFLENFIKEKRIITWNECASRWKNRTPFAREKMYWRWNISWIFFSRLLAYPWGLTALHSRQTCFCVHTRLIYGENTFRYREDVLSLNNKHCIDHTHYIYPTELEISYTKSCPTSESNMIFIWPTWASN